jgi:flagellar hook protein FlgE
MATGDIALTPGTQLDTASSPFTTPAFTLYDQLGNAVNNATLQFNYTGTGSQWDVELLVGGASTTPPTTASAVDIGTGTATLSWDPDGTGAQTPVSISLDTSAVTSVTGGGSTVAATADGSTQAAFDPADASTYNSSTSLAVYDTLGAEHLATIYFRKNGVPNQWETYSYVDGIQRSGPDMLEFASDGSIQTTTFPNSFTVASFDPGGGAAPMTLDLNFGDSTQYGSPFSINNLTQDGYTTGRLNGMEIGDAGVITARYTNGQSRTLGQVALANFNNPQGLQPLGGTNWAETYDSGTALVGAPGAGSLGLIESGALESSNVDLTEQLVNMITAQRNFQANAQVITAADTITQTMINIR